MKADGLLRLRLAFLSGLTFTGVRRRAVSHGRRFLGQLETHAQMGSIVDGVLGRALRAGFDAGRRSAEGASGDLRRGRVALARETREVGLETHLVGFRKQGILPFLGDSLVLLGKVRDAR
jgi:hypothetical protein